MNKWMLIAALMIVPAASAQATPAKLHHSKRHYAHPNAMTYPDSVTLEGKNYKVCKPGVEDDCVEPRQAGLGFGNRPTNVYRPAKDPHP